MWKILKDKNRVLEVSEHGKIRKKKKNGGYYNYNQTEMTGGYLQSAGRPVHQLVAMAYLGHTPDGHNKVVHHIDGNNKNNHFSNLEITSQSKNILSKRLNKTSETPFVTFCKNTKRYKVTMKAEGKYRYYGSFSKEEDAVQVAKTIAGIYKPECLELF